MTKLLAQSNQVHLDVLPYNPARDFGKVMQLIESEGEEWNCYSTGANRKKYEKSLSQSITYIACSADVLCGYSRSIDDFGFDIYICDLLVHESYRGKSIGKHLIERVTADFPNRTIYVMSDVDEYLTTPQSELNENMVSG